MKNNLENATCEHGMSLHCNNEIETITEAHDANTDMSFLPDAVSGAWSVSTFEVSENDLSQMISKWKTGRFVPAGRYKQLTKNGKLIMSNTPDEIRDFTPFVKRAYGSVLINGLGLGCVIKVLLSKPEVTKITVIEKSEDVMQLVAPYFSDDRLKIIHADAFEYIPPKGEKYDFVWHDIWNHICSDNLKEMEKLHRKYAQRTRWQDSWAKALCKKQERMERYF